VRKRYIELLRDFASFEATLGIGVRRNRPSSVRVHDQIEQRGGRRHAIRKFVDRLESKNAQLSARGRRFDRQSGGSAQHWLVHPFEGFALPGSCFCPGSAR
jgi:hypothetical protein